jgi:integrase
VSGPVLPSSTRASAADRRSAQVFREVHWITGSGGEVRMPGTAAVVTLHGQDLTILGAVDAFLAQADLAASTRGEYGKHLGRLAGRLGADRPLAAVTAGELEAAITGLWGAGRPRTWNQRLAVVGSFLAFARRRGWAAGDLTLGLDRRRVRVDRTRVPTPAELERFWAKPGVPLLVKTFSRLQYETAARATELLSADIADLDMENRRLRVTSKSGDVEWVYFQSGAARLLPRLLRGRSSGPLFVTALRPGPARAPAAADVSPTTGRVRISYRRMAELVVQHSGWPTHTFRKAQLSHLGAKGYGDAALQTKSRHKSRRSLEPYVNVPDELAAKITAETDPHRRRR